MPLEKSVNDSAILRQTIVETRSPDIPRRVHVALIEHALESASTMSPGQPEYPGIPGENP
jgi:hypothetical protein